MKDIAVYVLIALLVLSNLFLWFGKNEEKVVEKEIIKEEKHNEGEHNEGEGEVELAFLMAHFQRFADKLYFSGMRSNTPLAEFYLEEMEETAENIIKSKLMHDGVDISSNTRNLLMPAIETLEDALKKNDKTTFETAYNGLITACNGCHAVSKHEFIKIITPKEPAFSNQDFNK